jgi:hypothetical protein
MSTVTTKPCPRCGGTKDLEVQFSEVVAYESGAKIQDAFPRMSADDRERLLTGYCPDCWNQIFPEEEDEDET